MKSVLPLVGMSLGLFSCMTGPAQAGVIINEFQAAPNEILVDYDSQGMPRIGYGPAWWELGFFDGGWLSGNAPIGHSTTGLGTDVGTAMDDKTPSLYVRKSFIVPAFDAAQTTDLILRVWYDDGFVAYLNGREITRANLGPAKQITYRDQVTYRAVGTDQQPADYNLGPANTWLVTGENILAIQMHNRDLGGACRIDASLTNTSPLVSQSMVDILFDDANGASRTHQRNGATVNNTGTGVPAPGNWLALAPDPTSDPAWTGLTIVSTSEPTAGIGGTGAQRWSVSQSAAGNFAASIYGPPVTATIATPGAITVADLDRMDLSFRFQTSANATFGFRIEPQPGVTASALTGFSNISLSTAVAEDPLQEFANNAGGTRTMTVDSTGGGVLTTSGLVRHSPVLEYGPALRSSAFRYSENSTAGAGNAGSTGALKFEITDPPDNATQSDWFQFYRGGHVVRGWTAGSVSESDLSQVNLTFAYKLPAGQTYRIFVQPDHASGTYADRADFGSITGTGTWQVFYQPFSAASNNAAFRTKMNSLGITTNRIYFRGEATVPSFQPLWIDSVGFSTAWRVYSVNLGSASAASKTAFVAALNAVSSTTFTPVITKSSSAITPAADVLTMDDFRMTWRVGGGQQSWVPQGTSWKYFIGRHEPSGGFADPAEFADPLYDGDMSDWIELHNDGAAPVNLSGWGLTDDAALPLKWTFPTGTTIPAGGYLVVIADGRTTPLAGAQFLHTNFSLSADAEHLTLRDPSGVIVSDVSNYTKQNAWHTYGKNPTGLDYGYLRHGTPGRANSGPFLPERVKTPDFSLPGGFYSGTQTVSILSETPGATVRYTTDGSEPSSTSTVYTAPLTLPSLGTSQGHCLRARAFMAGNVSSEIKTATYLIDQDSRLRSAPALIFTGDPGRSMYAPYGITAIVGGTRDGAGVWNPVTSSDYNNVLGDLNNALTGGQAWERPFNLEWRYPDGRTGFNEDVGIRVSGSGHARPRYTLTGIQNAPWSHTNFLEKPSFNVFFRNEYGNAGVSHQIFPSGYPVEYFEQLRIRAGKNDVSNPFVRDEFMRRLFIECGQQGSRGVFNTLYVNGKFRGTYNMTERLREPFMQQHFNSTEKWDVRQVTEIANGDATAFNNFVALIDAYGADPTNQTKYNTAVAQLDVPAYIDYALVNIWGGTGDWPHNNYVASRERSATGKWRWFVWDAEGAFGGFSKHLGYNVITQDLLASVTTAGREICRTYERLSKNAEFRLQFADRIHKHFCNGGAMSDSKLTSIRNDVMNEYSQLFNYMFPSTALNTTWFSSWVHATNLDKRDVLFNTAIFDDPTTTSVVDPKEFGYQFSKANVWPVIDGQGTWDAPHPPKFSQHGGDVPANYALSILHTEPNADRTKDEPYRTATSQTPAARTIYYTLNGSDPRLIGGGVSPSALIWSAPVTLTSSYVTVKSRIRNTTNSEWSPLTETTFRVGADSPTTANLVIAELNYNPSEPLASEAPWIDENEFEFIRVLNIGQTPVKLAEARFVNGVSFDFAMGSIPVLDAGQSAFVVANAAAFRARYGNGYDGQIAGEYTGTSLSNSGERVRLENTVAVAIQDFTYDDVAPWPSSPDGGGPTLVLRNPASAPDHSVASNWVASARPGGLLSDSPSAMTYARWRALFWNPAEAANDNLSGPNADPDGDGVTNFAEYGLGSNPFETTNPLTGFLDQVGPDNVLCVEFRLLANPSGLTVRAEYSTQLTTWFPATQLSPPVANSDGTVTHRYYAPPGVGNRAFLRVGFEEN